MPETSPYPQIKVKGFGLVSVQKNNMERKKNSEKKSEENEETEQEDKKKESKEVKIVVIFILALAAIFICAFVYIKFFADKTPEYPTYVYNGFKFTKIAGLWNTEWQEKDKLYYVHLRYGPREAESVPYDIIDAEGFNQTGTIYITFDPEGKNLGYVAVASTEMSLSLSTVFNATPTAACTKNITTADDICTKKPTITCENSKDPVIYMKEADEEKITLNRNCLIIQGKGEDLIRAADKVVWIWYGIIK